MELVEYRPAIDRPPAPLCSVCIAHYRGSELLATCLESLLEQDCDFEYEIIVHDDASSDGSLEFLSSEYPQVEVLASAENVGFCVSNNRMVEHARGKFVLLLNNDAALLPDALSTFVQATAQKPSAIFTLPQYDWESGVLVDRGCLLDPFYNPVPNLDPDRAEVAMVIGACLWIEREQWIRLGGFPEWFESVGEDLYLCCAARLIGLKVFAISQSGYRHRQGQSFGGNKPSEGRLVSSYRRRRLSERNKTFALFIMTPTALMWPLLGVHLALLAIEGVFFCLANREPRIWKEIYSNVYAELKNKQLMLRQKRRAQQQENTSGQFAYFHAFTILPRKLTMLLHYGWPRLSE